MLWTTWMNLKIKCFMKNPNKQKTIPTAQLHLHKTFGNYVYLQKADQVLPVNERRFTKDTKEILKVRRMFIILIAVVVSQVYPYIEISNWML